MEDMAVRAGDIVFLVAPGVPEGEVPVVGMTVHTDLASGVGRQGFRAWGGHPARALAAARFDVRFGLGMTNDASAGISRAFQIAFLAVLRGQVAIHVIGVTGLTDLRSRRGLCLSRLVYENEGTRKKQKDPSTFANTEIAEKTDRKKNSVYFFS
jgi:hypothetical protein